MKSDNAASMTVPGHAVQLPPFGVAMVKAVQRQSNTTTSSPPFEVVRGTLVDRPLFRPRGYYQTK